MPLEEKKAFQPLSGTPLDFARLLGNEKVAAYLESIGAKTAAELEKR